MPDEAHESRAFRGRNSKAPRAFARGASDDSVKRDDYAGPFAFRRRAPSTRPAPAARQSSANGASPEPPPVNGRRCEPPTVVDVVPSWPSVVVVSLPIVVEVEPRSPIDVVVVPSIVVDVVDDEVVLVSPA